MQARKKRIDQRDITGDRGIALIHTVVGEMGFVWNRTGLEAGIDGYIEIRDPVTGEMTNLIVQIQSKATDRSFKAESPNGFDYYCDERDLNYWLSGNAPVILVCSRPSTNEAYWVSVKDYFKDLSARATRKIHFDKVRNQFKLAARGELFTLAKPKDSGSYLSPLPKHEKLYSNLLKVESIAPHLYLADTDCRSRGELWSKFDDMGVVTGSEWILKNKRIMTFHNLEDYPWRDICDPGTIEPFGTDEWADSDDTDIRRDFVELLNYTLEQKLRPEVLYKKRRGYYFFPPTDDLSPRDLYYKSLAKKTHRTVFKGYPKKRKPDEMSYYRHSAFIGQFVRYGGVWHLEITPTYRFTWNGYWWSYYGEELLKGIKRQERNPAALGQVVMWADYLSRKQDMFTTPYPFLAFGSLLSFDIEAGIDDKSWLPILSRFGLSAPANHFAATLHRHEEERTR